MNIILLPMLLLFVAYLFIPEAWYPKFLKQSVSTNSSSKLSTTPKTNLPEDSTLRRHYITQLRSEIALELTNRPTDFSLVRHYETLLDAELQNRLAS